MPRRAIAREGAIDMTVEEDVESSEYLVHMTKTSQHRQRLSERLAGSSRSPMCLPRLPLSPTEKIRNISASLAVTMRAQIKPVVSPRRFLGFIEGRQCLPRAW
jgi:hypothetical protein